MHAMSFDFPECFTASARLVMPQVVARQLAFSFDVDVPACMVEGDQDLALRTLQRLLLAALDLLQAGLLACSSSLDDEGRATVRLTGAGAVVGLTALTQVLQRMEMREEGFTNGAMVARGTCPVSGAQVLLVHDASEGFVLDAHLPFRWTGEPAAPLPSAQGAPAWVLLPRHPGIAYFKRRLTRLGWQVSVFDGPKAVSDARDRLATESPALVIAVDPLPVPATETLQWLQLPFASQTPRVLSSPLGSHCWTASLPSTWRLYPLPFSPRDLAELTALQEPDFDVNTLPDPFYAADTPAVLLVIDDNPTNRLVASAMARALGYEPMVAESAEQGVELSAVTPPAAVLMDIHMPGMDGLQATAHIRARQKAGTLAPFPIIGASADTTADNQAAALAAGMDAFLAKPIMIRELASELRRRCLQPPTALPPAYDH